MSIFSKKSLIVILMSIINIGCVVQSSQLGGLVEILSGPSNDLQENSWSVRYANYESLAYAVVTEEGILFTNKAGDEIIFDGWTFRKIRRLGGYPLNITIDDTDHARVFLREGRILSKHECEEWKRQSEGGLVRFTQSCMDRQKYDNSILVRENGDISVIRQIVDQRYTALTLTKLK